MISPLAVALQGIGYSALLVAVQGFAATSESEPGTPTTAGGSSRLRKRYRPAQGMWRPMPLLDRPVEDEEALFMLRMI